MIFGILAFLLFVLILSVLVFIHELGHFSAAKKFGIKVDEFGMGIPPRAWGKQIGETLYSLNWLPLGGFVKIRGEDMDEYDPNDQRNFMNKPAWQRAIVLFAGVFMNFILAFVLFCFVLGMNGWKSAPLMSLTDYDFRFGQKVNIPNVVTGIEKNSPAESAGITAGNAIVSISFEGKEINPQNISDLKSFIADKNGKALQIKTINLINDETNVYEVTPVFNEEINQPALGVSLSNAMYLDYSASPLFAGVEHSYNVMGYSFSILKELIGISVKEKTLEPVSQGVSGPVGIFGAVKSVLDVGGPKVVFTILDLTALLSLSLAVMNLLPIPALDGGRLFFIAIEVITRHKPSAKLENMAHQIGFMVLIGILILVTFKDIWQLFL